ncbi:universal stress protein [Variovorax sp. YR216]|uniref:universal stress protein n=1 Tax=Variovorax sp. YR216 TaxID=1882828 RepID=UPI000896B570|nr:universal stress protein [Variovorax sp. YR216]SEA55092.1 Nucleotide-binding universal stress protein, UspA family [Variovorax sp. YR216]
MTDLQSFLVHLDGTRRAETRLDLALRLALPWRARVSALFAVERSHLPLLPVGPGIPPLPPDIRMEAEHRRHALAVYDQASVVSGQPCEWLDSDGAPVIETFTQRALLADLLFLGQWDPDDPASADVPADFVESVVIGSGRPAWIVPHTGELARSPDVVLLAWKPTRECARALAAAIPFLQNANHVHLVEEDGDEMQPLPVKVRDYLHLYGIERVHEHARLTSEDAGEQLLSIASDCDADLLVMGCYGHSRARELLLGGVTRTVLDSMTLPVLMAH